MSNKIENFSRIVKEETNASPAMNQSQDGPVPKDDVYPNQRSDMRK